MKISPFQAAAALTLAVGAAASAQSISVTHSLENTFTVPGSIACQVPDPQRTTENSYFRSFDLTQFPQVTGAFHITELEIGIENAVTPTGSQELIINFYVDCDGGTPSLSGLTLVNSSVYELFDIGGVIEFIPVDVTVCQDATVVVEIISPDHTEQPDPGVFFIGSNDLGETAPSFLMAADCGITDPATFVSIGFPNVHVVMTLFGDEVAECVDPCEASCPCACDMDLSTGPGVCDLFDFLAFQGGFVAGETCQCDIDTSTGPGVCDLFDFLAFQGAFVVGCP